MLLFFSSLAYGHGLYDPLPKNIFQIKWDFDPTLVFFVCLGILYYYGLKKFAHKKPVARWQVGLFYTGLALAILSLMPPIDPLSDQLFFVHMIQHIIMTSMAVPFILFGIPFYVVVRGMPHWLRKKIYYPLLRSRIVNGIFGFLILPIPALMFHEGMLLFWHVPYYYNLALFNDYYHLLEHACFAVSAMFLWRNIIAPYPVRSPLPLPARLLFLALMEAANIALSAYLTFTKTVVYGYEGIPQPSWWTDGYLQDQQLGGLIMWIPGGIIHFLALTICFFVWANGEQKKDQIARERLAMAES